MDSFRLRQNRIVEVLFNLQLYRMLWKHNRFPRTWATRYDVLFLFTGLITRVTTRRVSLVEQELRFLPEHLFQWDPCYSIIILCVMFYRSLFVLFVLFLLAIELSVLLRFTDSDYPFGIIKLVFLARDAKTQRKEGWGVVNWSLSNILFLRSSIGSLLWICNMVLINL